MLASDAYEVVHCKTCGTIATTLALGGGYACKLCKTEANFGRLTIPYVFKHLYQLLNGMGIFMNFKLVTENEYRNLRAIQGGAKGENEDVVEIDADEIQKMEDEDAKKKEEEEEENEGELLNVENVADIEFNPEGGEEAYEAENEYDDS